MAWPPQASVPGGFADEASLLAGLRAGRREAYEALHQGFASPIYNLALRIVDDPHDAQDVAQEVLIKVFRSLPRDTPDMSLAAWLYRVTVNASFDHLRARKRRPVAGLEAEPELAAVGDDFERAELAGRVDATLRSLPKRQQLALVLRDVHGMSVGETASVLGVTRGSADVLLSRARRTFRRAYLAGDAVAAAPAGCHIADEALAAGVGGGLSAERRASLLEHARSCPDCRRRVELWGAAPVGLGLLVHQAALPAGLSLSATLAAASAAGVAIPAAAGAGAAAAASAAGASASAVGGSAAAGLFAKVGAAVGMKAVAVAAAATVAAGAAGVAGLEVHRAAGGAPGPAASAAAPGSLGRMTAAGVLPTGPRGASCAREDSPALVRDREGRREHLRDGLQDGQRSGSAAVKAKNGGDGDGGGGPVRSGKAATAGAGTGSAGGGSTGAARTGPGSAGASGSRSGSDGAQGAGDDAGASGSGGSSGAGG